MLQICVVTSRIGDPALSQANGDCRLLAQSYGAVATIDPFTSFFFGRLSVLPRGATLMLMADCLPLTVPMQLPLAQQQESPHGVREDGPSKSDQTVSPRLSLDAMLSLSDRNRIRGRLPVLKVLANPTQPTMVSSSAVLRSLRSIAPVATIAIGVVTLVSCVLIAKVKHIYLSGLFWPYFSDTGRDPPAYYVFCAGLTIVAVLTGVCWHNNYDFQMMAMKQSSPNSEIPKKLARLAGITRIAGLISIIGLPILAFMDVANHPIYHRYGACWFFGWEWFVTCVNTYTTRKLAKAPLPPTVEDVYASMETQPGEAYVSLENQTTGATVTAIEQERIKTTRTRTWKAQVACCILFVIGLIPYLPIGAMLPYCDRLTISRCLEMDLGESYCTERMRLDDTRTLIYACEDNFWNAQIPALGQLVCVLCLIGYTLTFVFHVYQDEKPATTPITPIGGKDVE